MTHFSWNNWLVGVLSLRGARKPRRARVARIENLEDRSLLTANLPVAVSDTYSVDQDVTLTATTSVLANDTDADADTIDQAVLQNNVTNGILSFNTNGTFTYIPNAGFTGTDTFTYFARDSLNAEQSATAATVTINVTANSAPTVSPVTISTTTNTAATGTLTATDADGDTLTFSEGATAETNGTVVINPDGSFTFTPTTDFTGVATFSFRANDGSINSTDATVTINVNAPTNTAPVVNPVTLSTTINTPETGTLTGVDAEGDTLTFSEGSTAETNGTVVINSDGTFTFTPTTDFTGVATFSFKASDGVLTSDDATVTINVTAVANTAPTVVNDSETINVNAVLNGSLVSLATDAEGDALTFAVASQPSDGTVVVNSNGTFTFTPNNNFVGTTSFTFTASDGSLTSTPGTFTITISDVTEADFDLELQSTVTVSNTPSSPTPLDPNAAITNVTASTDFANAQATVSFESGVDSKKDRLVVIKRDGAVRVKGKKIFVNDIQVAERTSSKKKGVSLQISFNSSATEQDIEAVLRRVAIRTTPSANLGVRVVQFQLSADGATTTDSIEATV